MPAAPVAAACVGARLSVGTRGKNKRHVEAAWRGKQNIDRPDLICSDGWLPRAGTETGCGVGTHPPAVKGSWQAG